MLHIDSLATDSTISIVNERGLEGTILCYERGSVVYDAFNRGVRLGTGDVVGFCIWIIFFRMTVCSPMLLTFSMILKLVCVLATSLAYRNQTPFASCGSGKLENLSLQN